jgi:NAD(P)H-dependent FMN reductase
LTECSGYSADGAGGSAEGLVVLGVCGSLRAASTNGGLLRAAGAHVRAHGGEFRLGDISLLPLYSQDLDTGGQPPPPTVEAWRSAVAAADAVVFASPEHNYSISAALKNAIDWASSASSGRNLWAGKTGAVVSAGDGAGGVRGQLALRQIAAFIDVSLLNAPEVAVRRLEEGCFDGRTGDLASSKWDARVGELVDRLMTLCTAMQQARPSKRA